MLAGRYRIVALLGRGGMGEVYRADDLKLSQPVALKFLPEALQHDQGRLQRFYGEISLARQITHPTVCRVYDIEELDGQHFLSMEYVDGEDLATLLRRIGRLPHDKALEIARQLCAGLAAAHEQGVLHRDLKPANVMIDGRGRARLTDFGLAALDETVSGAEVRSGTPAYMAPEQLAGREVTARSDVYALGLVLYELFTGRRPFDGRTLDDLRRQHAEQAPESPAALVEGLDPAVERAILRCLEKDPRRRPPSALAVAAALPGGDPLAAALAAGETPSPELVAAAQRATRLRASTGWLALAVAALTLAATVALMRRSHVLQHLPPAKPPLVLEDRAHELLLQLAPQAAALDAACGAQFDEEYFRSEAWRDADQGGAAWRGLRAGDPPVAQFWCRQGPAPLVPRNLDGQVGWADPPTLASDMAGVRLDLTGRLLAFYAVTPQRENPPEAPPGEPDWAPLLAAARLDPAALRPVDPIWTPPFHTDRRVAWEGRFPARPDLTLRIEAASYRGRPVFFRLVTPWTRAERMQPPGFTAGQRVAISFFLLLFTALLSAGVWLARRHLGSGRGDRRGAVRLAGATLLAGLASWALQTHYVADQLAQAELLARGLGGVLLLPAVILVFYLALEPYARRIWPEMLISWTRAAVGWLARPDGGPRRAAGRGHGRSHRHAGAGRPAAGPGPRPPARAPLRGRAAAAAGPALRFRARARPGAGLDHLRPGLRAVPRAAAAAAAAPLGGRPGLHAAADPAAGAGDRAAALVRAAVPGPDLGGAGAAPAAAGAAGRGGQHHRGRPLAGLSGSGRADGLEGRRHLAPGRRAGGAGALRLRDRAPRPLRLDRLTPPVV